MQEYFSVKLSSYFLKFSSFLSKIADFGGEEITTDIYQLLDPGENMSWLLLYFLIRKENSVCFLKLVKNS